MLPSLKELGLLSARYAEEEAVRAQQCVTLASVPSVVVPKSENDGNTVQRSASSSSSSSSSTIVSAPIPTQKVVGFVSSTGSCSSSSLPGSPLIFHSPSNGSNESAVVIPFVPQRASFPSADKLQQVGLSFIPMASPFTALSTPQGLLISSPMSIPAMNPVVPPMPSTLPTTVLAPTPQFTAAAPPPPPPPPPPVTYPPSVPSVEVGSSIANSRIRKPFHKRRPAHMDKNMLFCHFCGRKETPEWRKGPSGPATLCNACGLQWAKKIRAQRSSSSTKTKTSSAASNKKSDVSESEPTKVEC